MSKHRVDEALGGAHVDFDTGKTHPHIPGGVIDLRKQAASTQVGQLIDQSLQQPVLTAEDLGYATPLGDTIFVQMRQAAKRSKGGILLPDEAQPTPNRGVVVAVGPGNHTISGVLVPVGVVVGDQVQFAQQSWGNRIEVNGHMVLPVKEHDLYCAYRPPSVDEAGFNKQFATPAAVRTE